MHSADEPEGDEEQAAGSARVDYGEDTSMSYFLSFPWAGSLRHWHGAADAVLAAAVHSG